MSEVTRILSAIEQGDPHAAEQLLPLVYDELRKLAVQKMAQEKPGQTLEATALVHEAYLRLVDVKRVQHWNSRGHFFAAAAEAMRRILIENARSKARRKRGGDWQRVDFETLDVTTSVSADQLIALDDALARLVALDHLAGELVKLRYFAGLALDQAAPGRLDGNSVSPLGLRTGLAAQRTLERHLAAWEIFSSVVRKLPRPRRTD